MDAGVDDQADGAEEFAREAAVVADRVLVEADLLAELLGVERPALGVAGVAAVLAELGQAGELLRDGELHVVAGDALVIGGGLVVDEAAVGEVGGGDDDAAGALAVGGAGLVVRGNGGLEGGDGLDGDRGVRG